MYIIFSFLSCCSQCIIWEKTLSAFFMQLTAILLRLVKIKTNTQSLLHLLNDSIDDRKSLASEYV